MTVAMEKSCASAADTNTMPRDKSGDIFTQNAPYTELSGRARLSKTGEREMIYHHPAVPELAGVAARALSYEAETNGRRYDVLRLEPLEEAAHHQEHSFNITPAFLTRHDSGITLALAMHAVKAGFPVNSISQERKVKGGKNFPSLNETAINQIAIADTLERKNGNESEMLSYNDLGFSRGGILTFRRALSAHHLGRSAGYLEVLAAVCHHDSPPLRTMKMFASLLPREAQEVFMQIKDNPRQIKLFLDTVGHDLETLSHAYNSAGTLLGARTADVIDQLPSHQKATVTVYERDPFGHRKAYRESFHNHPEVQVRYVEDTAHMGPMRESERSALGERIDHYATRSNASELPAA